MHPLAALYGTAVLAGLLYVPGSVIARVLRLEADLFARVWCGLAALSVVGLLLAFAGHFSLPVLIAALASLSLALHLVGGRRVPAAGAGDDQIRMRRARMLACAAGLGAVLWCWPPFETVIAGSDSTMYLSAGIHLARTGSFVVRDTVASRLPERTARAIFPSVALSGAGPYIRLPGGLLTDDLLGGIAVPAFFPLLPVWVGVLVLLGGPEAAPAVAPLFAGLSVWVVALFAGEAFGLAAAAAAALLLAVNFAFWWFGRFAMSETLALVFLWGGVTLAARAAGRTLVAPASTRKPFPLSGSAFAAGLLFGIGGLARTESFLFVALAVVLWGAWTSARVPVGALAIGFALPLALGTVLLATFPSHHLTYLRDAVALRALLSLPKLVPAWRDGRLVAAPFLLAALVAGAGLLGSRFRIGLRVGVARAVTLLAFVGAVLAVTQIAGAAAPQRQLAWLAAYCSWPLLGLAVLGSIVLWRHGDPGARLAIALVVVVAAVFMVNPRIATYHPWAMRRFLPVVIPWIAIAGAATLGMLAGAWRPLAVVALGATLGLATFEMRPILAVRDKPFFAGTFAAMRDLAEGIPDAALVGVDYRFADMQLQVPLWLAYGRETFMSAGESLAWREAMAALAESGRPLYWIANSYEHPPEIPGLRFRPARADLEIAVTLPDAPAAAPPTHSVTRVVPLRIYLVETGVATGASGVGVW